MERKFSFKWKTSLIRVQRGEGEFLKTSLPKMFFFLYYSWQSVLYGILGTKVFKSQPLVLWLLAFSTARILRFGSASFPSLGTFNMFLLALLFPLFFRTLPRCGWYWVPSLCCSSSLSYSLTVQAFCAAFWKLLRVTQWCLFPFPSFQLCDISFWCMSGKIHSILFSSLYDENLWPSRFAFTMFRIFS